MKRTLFGTVAAGIMIFGTLAALLPQLRMLKALL